MQFGNTLGAQIPRIASNSNLNKLRDMTSTIGNEYFKRSRFTSVIANSDLNNFARYFRRRQMTTSIAG